MPEGQPHPATLTSPDPAQPLAELRERLVHIEAKLDQLAAALRPGHADQAFGGRTYAQFGEDVIFLNVFGQLGVERPSYIDVGAHHPYNISNTALLYERGCRGLNIEANPTLLPAFQHHRPEDVNLNVGVAGQAGTAAFHFIDDWSGRNTFSREMAEAFVREYPRFSIQRVEQVAVMTLNEIVDRHNGGRFNDLLTLDAEGLDVEILQSLQFQDSAPTLICVEPISGPRFDASPALLQVMREKGYVPYVATLGNLLFLSAPAARQLGVGSG